MTAFALIAQSGEGDYITTPVPWIELQTVFIKKLGVALVTFEIRASPSEDFYPHFTTTNLSEISEKQQDFLWEKSCYELFIAFDKEPQNPYVEINFSPKGAFNLYHFDGYRMPKQMPPRRLMVSEAQRKQLLNFYYYQPDKEGSIWQNSLSNTFLLEMIATYQPLKKDIPSLVMIVNAAMIADLLQVNLTDTIWLNPCAVFENANNGLAYFARQHTAVPDFHAKTTWPKQETVTVVL